MVEVRNGRAAFAVTGHNRFFPMPDRTTVRCAGCPEVTNKLGPDRYGFSFFPESLDEKKRFPGCAG